MSNPKVKCGRCGRLFVAGWKNARYCSNQCRRTIDGIANEVVSMYNTGSSCRVIADQLGVCSETVRALLKRLGVKLREPSTYRKHRLDEGSFDSINNEGAAWLLGYLLADGHVNKPNSASGGYYVTLELAKRDRPALVMMNEVLKSNYPIIETGHSLRLFIGSKRLHGSLMSLGFRRLKSDGVVLPRIDDSFRRHLIRGLFDGDGWVCTRLAPKPRCCVGLCGSPQMLTQVVDIIHASCNISRPGLVRCASTKTAGYEIAQIGYGSVSSCVALYEYLYKGTEYALPRKKLKFKKFYNTVRPHGVP